MARRGSGLGFVMLLVVVAVALLLAAKAWQRSGSAALALDPASPTAGAQDRGPAEAAEARDALRELPDLGAMRDATSRHSDAVQEALAATDE